MTGKKMRLIRAILAANAGFGCLFVSEKALLIRPVSLVTEAHAIIGRPLTPMSYAGVARRTTRRTYAYGAAAAAAAYPAVGAYGARCVQVANAYGRLVTVCR